jgi:hypothetical protein
MFWTVTSGGEVPTGTGTLNLVGPVVIIHDDVYSCKLGTHTVAVLQIHLEVRTDSGTAPGFVLSIFALPPLGKEEGAVNTRRRGGG